MLFVVVAGMFLPIVVPDMPLLGGLVLCALVLGARNWHKLKLCTDGGLGPILGNLGRSCVLPRA